MRFYEVQVLTIRHGSHVELKRLDQDFLRVLFPTKKGPVNRIGDRHHVRLSPAHHAQREERREEKQRETHGHWFTDSARIFWTSSTVTMSPLLLQELRTYVSTCATCSSF